MDKLEILRESLGRSNQMTDNMIGILTSFEDRLRKLEDTITPVYLETGNLQRRHENIEKTLSSLDHVISYFHVAEQVEPSIREGPGTDLENYLECMEKLKSAVTFFDKNSHGSKEMSQVTTLFEAGKDSLEREFRQLLTRHSKPVPAIMVLDVLTQDEELPNEEPSNIEHLPVRVKSDLSQIAQWLLNSGYNTDYMTVYASVRSTILVKSLQMLRDHLKSRSKDSGNVTMSHSPALSTKVKTTPKDTPSRKALKRMTFVSKTAMKQSIVQHLEAAGLKRQGGASAEPGEGRVEVDIDFYITGVSAMLKLIQSEMTLMEGIIPVKHQKRVFDQILQGPLDSIKQDGEQIAANIKRAIARHDHSAVIGVFPVLRHLRATRKEFEATLQGCSQATRLKLPNLIGTLDTTGAKGLEEFVDSIKNDPDKASNMPRDGTVHELTSNTIIFLEQMLEFADTAGAMLLTQDPAAVSTRVQQEHAKKKVAEFITKVLSALGLNLSNKAETYGDVTLRPIFMLNNYNYILKSLKRTGLLDVAVAASPDLDLHYEDQILDQKRVYSQSWSRVLHFVMDAAKAPTPEAGKMKDKDKQAIKDKFTGFNKELEEVIRVQQGYSIPDGELRAALRQDNKEFVLPKYKAFLAKYRPIPFTKNPEKYIKYSVEDVSRHIDKLFDTAV